MNIKKQQKMDMYIERISWYTTYVDCFTRIITDFIENGEDNIEPCDIPNLMVFNKKLIHRLHKMVMNMKTDWEFM